MVVVVGTGVLLLSAQIRGFWGGQHDCRTGPGPEGLVPQARSWETRALLWRVDGGGRLGGWAAGRWLPCWEAASSAVLLGLEMATPLFLSVWGRAALEPLFILLHVFPT